MDKDWKTEIIVVQIVHVNSAWQLVILRCRNSKKNTLCWHTICNIVMLRKVEADSTFWDRFLGHLTAFGKYICFFSYYRPEYNFSLLKIDL